MTALPCPLKRLIRSEFSWLFAKSHTQAYRSLSEWCEAEFVIPKGPFRGQKFRLDTQPFARLYLEAIGSGLWTKSAVLGCVQAGKSTVGSDAPALYYVFEWVEDTIFSAPTEKVCRNKWHKELLPAILASRYADLLPIDGSGSRGGFADEIHFLHGATLKFMSAGGGDENRSGYSARCVVVTEADKMDTAGESSRETDPLRQLAARSAAWPEEDRRFHCECTVSIERGRIWQMYKAGTESRIACPCPHCGEFVTPERQHLLGWQAAETKAEARRGAFFACPSCGRRLSPDDRRAMNLAAVLLHRGQSIDADGKITGDPPDTDTLGFRWNAFNNLFWTAGEVGATEWARLHCEDEEAAERELCQFYWAIPYQSPDFDSTPLDADAVRKRFAGEKQYTRQIVPDDCEVLVAHVDLHKRFFYWMVVAWRPGCRGHIVDYGTWEVPSRNTTLERAILLSLENLRDDLILEGWPKRDGEIVVPQQVLVDAGWQSAVAYEFARQKASGRRFHPAIGYGASSRWRRYRSYRRPTKTGGEVKVLGDGYHVVWLPPERTFRIDVDADWWKTWAHERLRTPQKNDRGEPQGGTLEFYYSTDRNEHVTPAKHFAAEHPEEQFVADVGTVIRWIRTKRDNHYLDNLYNCCVAGHLCGVRLLKSRGVEKRDGADLPQTQASPIVSPDGRAYLVTDR